MQNYTIIISNWHQDQKLTRVKNKNATESDKIPKIKCLQSRDKPEFFSFYNLLCLLFQVSLKINFKMQKCP